MTNCGLYLRKNIVYIPTQAKTLGSGGHYEIDPTAAIPVSDHETLRQALKGTLARGNPLLKTSIYADIPKSSLLKLAGVKSFSAFASGTRTWSISEKDAAFKILFWKKGPVRGWVPDSENHIQFPPGSTEDDVIDRMIAILQEAAA